MNASIVRLGFVILLLGHSAVADLGRAAENLVVPYPRVPGDASNEHFSVRVNDVPIETAQLVLNVGYGHFSFRGTARVEVTIKEPIQTFDLSPHRVGIKATVQGNTISFDLNEPRKLHLTVNGLPRFFIFADAIDDLPRPGERGVVDLASLGIRSDPDRIQTAALQKAIDDAAAQQATLVVPAGIYRCGQLRLKSNLTLYLAPGAILKGTGRIEDYPAGQFGTQQIDLTDCRNVRIRGRGVIDGQGRALRLATKNSSAGRMKLIRSHRATDCTIEGIILRDSGTWGVHLIESTDLRFHDFKLISNTIRDDRSFPWEPNTDGFDPDNSSRVVIENGFVSCNDDAIALKLRYGRRRDMSNVRFLNNVVWTVKSALKIGSEVAERTLSDVEFANNDVIHADRGIVVYAYFGGTIENCRWIGNHFEFIGGDLKRMHIEIKTQVEEGKSVVRNLTLRDNVFEQEAEKKSVIRGLDDKHQIENVAIENYVVAGTRRKTLSDARIDAERYAAGVEVR